MPRILRNLKINEVSSVDRGAGEGVKVMLMKRAKPLAFDVQITTLDVMKFKDAADRATFFFKRPKFEAYCKREFSAKDRAHLADTGAAMSGGGFPIQNGSDLKNAIRAIGRAKDPSAAKAHIKTRARALGLSDLIPDTWKAAKGRVGGEKDRLKPGPVIEAVDTDESELDGPDGNDGLGGSNERIGKALAALLKSTASIVSEGGDQTDDLLEKSFAEFRAYVNGDFDMPTKTTQELIDASLAPINAVIGKIAKALKIDVDKIDDEAIDVVEKTADEIEAEKVEAARLAKIAKAKKGKGKPGSDGDAGTDDGTDGKDVDDEGGKAEKRMAEFAKSYPEIAAAFDKMQSNDALLKGLLVDRERTSFSKQAVDMGLEEKDGEMLRKAFGGDKVAQIALQKRITEKLKSAEALAKTAGVFSEFGSAQDGVGGDAYSQLMAKAQELRKTEPKLSEAQAFTKVWEDPANRELVVKSKNENLRKMMGVAA